MGVLEALRDFREDGGASLAGFVRTCAERKVLTAVRAATRQKHRHLNESLRVLRDQEGELSDAIDSAFASAKTDPEAVFEAREELAEVVAAFRERLSDLECRCLVGVLNDESYDEIAARYGLTEKQVDNALQRARWKLRGEDLHLAA